MLLIGSFWSNGIVSISPTIALLFFLPIVYSQQLVKNIGINILWPRRFSLHINSGMAGGNQ